MLSDADPSVARAVGGSRVGRWSRAGGWRTAVALRWTALEPGKAAAALFGIDAARDWQSFRAAAALFDSPTQNLVYADVDGHIGYQAPGRIPIRKGSDGRWPVPGWSSDYDWTGWCPSTGCRPSSTRRGATSSPPTRRSRRPRTPSTSPTTGPTATAATGSAT